MRRMFTALLLLVCLASITHAAILEFFTPLGPEAMGATGTGNSTVVVDTTAQTLNIEATWSGLSGTTSVAHIHCCTAAPLTGTVGVAVTPVTLPGFPVGTQAGSYSIMLDLTSTATYTSGFREGDTLTPEQASAKLLQGMFDGRAYFNIHTTNFPGGEIRGFLEPVPEPATFGFAGAALALLAFSRRFRLR